MQSHPPIVTLADIARKLGTSPGTVSRALRNLPTISDARRKEIQKMAKKMGYVPNAMAVGLVKQRALKMVQPAATGLAWLNCWPAPERLRQFKEFDLYWKGASEAAAKAGYHLEEFSCAEIPLNRLAAIFEARNIQGLLIPPFWRGESIDPSAWESFPWEKFSCVRFGYSCKKPAFHVVSGAQLNNATMAFKKIAEKGYRRIGYVGHKGIRECFTRFYAGYLLAQSEIVLSQKLPILFLPSLEENKQQINELLATWIEEHHPDAIFTEIGSLRAILEKLGYRVPEDFAMACTSFLDGDVNAGIDQNSEEIGRVAVQTLISLLTFQERGIPAQYHEVLIQGSWVDGSMMPGMESGKACEESLGALQISSSLSTE